MFLKKFNKFDYLKYLNQESGRFNNKGIIAARFIYNSRNLYCRFDILY